MHGWAIANRIRQMSKDVLQVGASALYPALHKQEQLREWRADERKPRTQSCRNAAPYPPTK
jgi:PadR family transcriptional regulator, regulatory protein PadR